MEAKKMKKYLAILIAVAMVSTMIPLAGASDTATIDVSFSNTAAAAITVSPDNYTFSVGIGESAENTSDSDYFTLTNVGNVTVDITIKGETISGGEWTLAGSAGVDTYSLYYDQDGSWDEITTGYLAMTGGTDLPPVGGTTISFDLQYTPPTTVTDGEDDEGAIITFLATAN